MCEYTINELEVFFYSEINDLSQNYGSYSDLANKTQEELWRHANVFGYKEQRQIFQDCSYNDAFYCNYLQTNRDIVLQEDPFFNWIVYAQNYSLYSNSEYYALIDFINRKELTTSCGSSISLGSSITQYSIISENPSYVLGSFPFHYGSGQESSANFGMVIPFRSKLLRGHFLYHYSSSEPSLEDFSFNTTNTTIKLELYIDGSMSNYYIEETFDATKSMTIGLIKETDISNIGCIINKTTPIIEENSILSWYCSELRSFINVDYTNKPYNPSRNRFVLVLEPI
ncbi:hypothetical protein 162322250 [Organic Lake phycodnavirus 1]|jgi:hypothetical protein|nr:hypothetical protein 162322250 [Organic Lake phycodnavirus 1]